MINSTKIQVVIINIFLFELQGRSFASARVIIKKMLR